MLEIRGCDIGKQEVLYHVSDALIAPGKVSVLIGANGAGKSTLLNAVALGNNRNGVIAYDGVALNAISGERRARILALVESRFAGNEYLSVHEYLELGRFPFTGFSGKLTDADKAVVSAMASRLSIDHLLGQSTLTLSDGERQRASVARALIQQTPVILLDEPTSFLDYPNKRSIMLLLQRIAQEENKLILMASHDLELCLEYADDFFVINPKTRDLRHFSSSAASLETLIGAAFPEMR